METIIKNSCVQKIESYYCEYFRQFVKIVQEKYRLHTSSARDSNAILSINRKTQEWIPNV